MVTSPTLRDIPDADARTPREILFALGIAVVVSLLVFLSIAGVISLINGARTLTAINAVNAQNRQLDRESAKFYRAVNSFEHNEYVVCVILRASNCIPPPPLP